MVRWNLGEVDANGKVQGSYSTVKGGVPVSAVDRHFAGESCLVLKPELPDRTCTWAMIDHDHYSEQTCQVIREQIEIHKLPLHTFASKSGGLHSVIFFPKPQPVDAVRELLAKFAVQIGERADVEIFPKPVADGKEPYGIAVPFFGNREAFEEFAPRYCDLPLNGDAVRETDDPQADKFGVRLPAGADFGDLLKGKLKFNTRHEKDATSYDYHGIGGQPCLLQGSIHAANRDNPRCSRFLVRGRLVVHQCFDSDCREIDGAKTRRALKAAGIDLGSHATKARETTVTSLSLVRFADIAPKAVRYLWPGRIALGKLNIWVGDIGQGKTFVSHDTAARVSRGARFPDGSQAPTGDTLILSTEDSKDDTIRPRLDSAGADVKRVVAVKSVTVTLSDGSTAESSFDLQRDLEKLERVAKAELPMLRLVIIDPLSDYLGGANAFRDWEVRRVLRPVVEFAERLDVAVVGIMHPRKAEAEALHRASGSLAFVAVARLVWGFGPHPDEPGKHVMIPMKNSVGVLESGLAYRIEQRQDDLAAHVEWEADAVNFSADDVIGGLDRERRDKRLAAAEEWLRRELAKGPRLKDEIEDAAKTANHSPRTLFRAKQALGVESHKVGMAGSWYWELPTTKVRNDDKNNE